MAIALVGTPAHYANDGAATTVAAPAKAHAAGNLLVVLVGQESSPGTYCSSVADTAGNTFILIDNAVQSSDHCDMFYAKNILGNANNIVTGTFTPPNTAAYRRITVFEFSGCDTTAPFTAGETGKASAASGTVMDTSSFTTAVADSVIVCGCMHNRSTTITAGDDNNGHTYIKGETATYYGTGYYIESATGTYVGGLVGNISAGWTTVAAAFRAAATESNVLFMTFES